MSFKSVVVAAAHILSVLAVDITVSSSGGNATSGHQYGFLHEVSTPSFRIGHILMHYLQDINNSGDGGIYAELLRNRAFQYSDNYPVSLSGWRSVHGAALSLSTLEVPLSDALPVSVNVAPGNCTRTKNNVTASIGLLNEGYWGMDVKQQTYTGSFWVKGAYDGIFTASLQSALTDDVFGTVEIESSAVADDWTEHEFELVPTVDAPNSNNTFAITFDPAV